jgi:hypothetical protein
MPRKLIPNNLHKVRDHENWCSKNTDRGVLPDPRHHRSEAIVSPTAGGERLAAELKTCGIVDDSRFLVTIFEAFSVTVFLPKEFQDYLRKSYLAHLTTWIEEALPIEDCRQAMQDLSFELMRIHKKVLYKPIDDLLNSPTFLRTRA